MQIKDILDSLFEYDTCTDNRYIIPKLPYKLGSSTEYIELLVTNGYVKLYTQKGRAYWISQFNIVSINLQIGNFTSTLHTKTSIKHGI